MGGDSKEIEMKVRNLTKEVFQKYGKSGTDNSSYANGEDYILKEDLKDFLLTILELSGDAEAWDEHRFEKAYLQIDKDGSGKVLQDEFMIFIKRFADL